MKHAVGSPLNTPFYQVQLAKYVKRQLAQLRANHEDLSRKMMCGKCANIHRIAFRKPNAVCRCAGF